MTAFYIKLTLASVALALVLGALLHAAGVFGPPRPMALRVQAAMTTVNALWPNATDRRVVCDPYRVEHYTCTATINGGAPVLMECYEGQCTVIANGR